MKNKFRTFFALLGAVVLSLGLLACGKEKDKVYDQDKIYDDITKTLKLERDYEGMTFKKDGVELVTVDYISDGDTVGFLLENGNDDCRLRFYCVDTPESTIKVEKWGMAASIFTTNILNNAKEVVLESSTGGVPETDSNGSRLLGYVWYRNDTTEDFKNLNLQLVENGFAELDISEDNPYYEKFTKAYDFAKKAMLHIHSFVDDPLFATDAIDVTLKDLVKHIDDYYDDETKFGAKVELTAYVTDLKIASSGTYNWTITQNIDGVNYSFPVFTGYASMQINNYLKIGNEYHIVGYVKEHAGHYQLSGLQYALAQEDPDYTKLTKLGAFITLNSNIKKYDTKYGPNLYSDAVVEAATLEGTTLKITANAYHHTVEGVSKDADKLTILVEVEAGFDAQSIVGKTVQGVLFVQTRVDKIYTAPDLKQIIK